MTAGSALQRRRTRARLEGGRRGTQRNTDARQRDEGGEDVAKHKELRAKGERIGDVGDGERGMRVRGGDEENGAERNGE